MYRYIIILSSARCPNNWSAVQFVGLSAFWTLRWSLNTWPHCRTGKVSVFSQIFVYQKCKYKYTVHKLTVFYFQFIFLVNCMLHFQQNLKLKNEKFARKPFTQTQWRPVRQALPCLPHWPGIGTSKMGRWDKLEFYCPCTGTHNYLRLYTIKLK